MKKAFLFLTGVLAILGLGSCNKEYSCVCNFPDASKNFEVKLEKMRKNDAKTVCFDYNVFVGNCNLK